MKDKTLKVASILLLIIVTILIYRVSILEKRINECSETLEALEEITYEFEDIKRFSIRQIYNDLSYLSDSTEILNDLILNKVNFEVYVGKGIEESNNFATLDGDIVELDYHQDVRTFVVGQYSYVEEDIENFIENILYYQGESSTIIVVDGIVKYMFQGNILDWNIASGDRGYHHWTNLFIWTVRQTNSNQSHIKGVCLWAFSLFGHVFCNVKNLNRHVWYNGLNKIILRWS